MEKWAKGGEGSSSILLQFKDRGSFGKGEEVQEGGLNGQGRLLPD